MVAVDKVDRQMDKVNNHHCLQVSKKVGARQKLALTLFTRGRRGRSAQMTLLLGLSDDSGCCSCSPPFATHAYLDLV